MHNLEADNLGRDQLGVAAILGWAGKLRVGISDGTEALVSSHRTVESGVPPSVMWSTPLVMPAQPVPGEC